MGPYQATLVWLLTTDSAQGCKDTLDCGCLLGIRLELVHPAQVEDLGNSQAEVHEGQVKMGSNNNKKRPFTHLGPCTGTNCSPTSGRHYQFYVYYITEQFYT